VLEDFKVSVGEYIGTMAFEAAKIYAKGQNPRIEMRRSFGISRVDQTSLEFKFWFWMSQSDQTLVLDASKEGVIIGDDVFEILKQARGYVQKVKELPDEYYQDNYGKWIPNWSQSEVKFISDSNPNLAYIMRIKRSYDRERMIDFDIEEFASDHYITPKTLVCLNKLIASAQFNLPN
jgi:hypothetical protein